MLREYAQNKEAAESIHQMIRKIQWVPDDTIPLDVPIDDVKYVDRMQSTSECWYKYCVGVYRTKFIHHAPDDYEFPEKLEIDDGGFMFRIDRDSYIAAYRVKNN